MIVSQSLKERKSINTYICLYAFIYIDIGILLTIQINF